MIETAVCRTIRFSRTISSFLRLVSTVLLGVQCGFAALDPETPLHRFILQNWQTEQGLPQNSVLALAQTSEGYLWLGTEEGLARYDGVRFVNFDAGNSGLPDNQIRALLVDRDNELIVGTQNGGLSLYRGGRFIPYPSKSKLPLWSISSLVQDPDGFLWVGTDNTGVIKLRKDGEPQLFGTRNGLPDNGILSLAAGHRGELWVATRKGLGRLQGSRFATVTANDGLASNDVRVVRADSDDNLWVGTANGLSRISAGKITSFTAADGLSGNEITSLAEDSAHTLWIGTGRSGLNRLVQGRFTSLTKGPGIAGTDIGVLLDDSQGDLWIGTGGHGLLCLKQGTFATLTTEDGLAANMILPVFEDAQRNLWIGSEHGLMKRSTDRTSTPTTVLTMRDGLPDDLVLSITQDLTGNMWIGTRRGLVEITDGKLRTFSSKEGLPGGFIVCTFADRKGNVWVGTRSGLTRFDGKTFLTYTKKEGLADDFVRCIQEDSAGTLWIGTSAGLSRFSNGKFLNYSTRDGLSGNALLAIHIDRDDTVWLAGAKGLDRLQRGRITSFSGANRVLGELVSAILEDKFGDLWLSSNRGINRFSKAALNEYAGTLSGSVPSVLYDTADGLRSRECNGGFQPAAWAGRDGNLYFPTTAGLAFTRPGVRSNTGGGKLVFERLVINDKEYSVSDIASVPPGIGKIEIQFSAPNLLFQNKVQFRYLLEGFDKDWINADTRRTAYYTNIPHGEYRFKVQSGIGGVWTESSSLPLVTLNPHFYKTNAFFVLVAILILSACAAAYRLRMEQAAARERKLRALVDERTLDLRESESQLRQSRDELELRVQDRTKELTHANRSLEDEVTTRRQTEELLILAKDAAESANRAKSDFLANMSHELRTPINGILGMTEMALSTELDEEQTEYLEIAKFSADSLLTIVSDILDFSKIEARKLTLDPTHFYLPQFIRDVFRSLQMRASQKNLQFDLQLSPDLPEHVFGDALRIRQILLNLLDNALKFTSIGSICLRVDLDYCEGQPGLLHFAVEDTGIGIPEEKREAIFEAFSQADNSSTRRYGGTGLGLTISYQLAEMLGGVIWVDSEVDRGSTFHFTAKVEPSVGEHSSLAVAS